MDNRVLFKLSYGLYVVTAAAAGKCNGQIANTLFQVTAEPAQVAVSINKANLTHKLIAEGGAFAASVLERETPLSFIGGLGFRSGRDADKFQGLETAQGVTGTPLVFDHALAWLDAKVAGSYDAGSHTIFVGRVMDVGLLREGEPMTYDYYHQVKGGSTPRTAPVYAPSAVGLGGRYVCSSCGYIYDPKKGDPEGGIDPETPFREVRADWKCPVCGAPKGAFLPER